MDYLKNLRLKNGFTRNHVCLVADISNSKLAKLERSEIDPFQCSYISMFRLYMVMNPEGLNFTQFVTFLYEDYNQASRWRNVDDEKMAMISSYMDEEARDQVHSELAPCDPLTFVNRYLEVHPDLDFVYILKNEFGLELD